MLVDAAIGWLRFLCRAFWIVSFVAYGVKFFWPRLADLARYGRFQPSGGQWNGAITGRFFTEAFAFRAMYCFAAFLGVASLCVMPTLVQQYGSAVDRIQWNHSLIHVVLMTVHVSRRAAECFFVHEFSNRKMSNIQFVWALGFYFCNILGAPLSLTQPTDVNLAYSSLSTYEAIVRSISESHLATLATIVFVACQLLQLDCHRILAAGRRQQERTHGAQLTKRRAYFIPQGNLFRYLSAPHYSLEIAAYACMLVIGRVYTDRQLLVLFVVLNLSDRALCAQYVLLAKLTLALINVAVNGTKPSFTTRFPTIEKH